MELHSIAKQFMSTVSDLEEFLSKGGRALIAVERHDKDSDEGTEPKDRFMWIKARTVSACLADRRRLEHSSSRTGRTYAKYIVDRKPGSSRFGMHMSISTETLTLV